MLCHTSLFILFLCHHVTFCKTLTSLSTVFIIKGHIRLLQLLKWPFHTSFFTHVEPLCNVYHRYSVISCNVPVPVIELLFSFCSRAPEDWTDAWKAGCLLKSPQSRTLLSAGSAADPSRTILK